jgi:hypothetical protein
MRRNKVLGFRAAKGLWLMLRRPGIHGAIPGPGMRILIIRSEVEAQKP